MKKYLICMIALLSVSLFGCNENIDVNDYVSVDVKGINGLGTLVYKINIDNNSNIEKIECNSSDDGHLKNRDNIDIACNIYTADKNNSKKHYLQIQTINYTVSNLYNFVAANDLFDFDIVGISGAARVVAKAKNEQLCDDIIVKYKYKEAIRSSFDYHTEENDDYKYHLKNGDDVIVTIVAKDLDAFNEKYDVNLDEMPFTINVYGLAEPTDNYFALSDELIVGLATIAENELIKLEDENCEYKYELIDKSFYAKSDDNNEAVCSGNSLALYFNCTKHSNNFNIENVCKSVIFDNVFFSYDNPLIYLDLLTKEKDNLIHAEEYDNLAVYRNNFCEYRLDDQYKNIYTTW